MSVKVLFVCLGNICRSPTAHGLFQACVDRANLAAQIEVDSAGTGDWHLGHPPDDRAQAIALERGYDISHLRARSVSRADFTAFDYILAMDRQNLANLKALQPDQFPGTLGLFLDISGIGEGLEVPDPYHGGQRHFEQAIELIEQGSAGLLARIQQEHDL